MADNTVEDLPTALQTPEDFEHEMQDAKDALEELRADFTPRNTSEFAQSRAHKRPGIAALSSPIYPKLVRTSNIQAWSPAPHQLSADINATFHEPMALPSVQLHFVSNLKEIGSLESWTEDQLRSRRRVVYFGRQQNGAEISLNFWVARPDEVGGGGRNRPQDALPVSCILWREENECYITSIDTIALLEWIMAQKFPTEEKSRIRRNLERFIPITVKKPIPYDENTDREFEDTRELWPTIMGFPAPKPRSIEKDIKLFRWEDLDRALLQIIRKYSIKPSTQLPLPQQRDHQLPLTTSYLGGTTLVSSSIAGTEHDAKIDDHTPPFATSSGAALSLLDNDITVSDHCLACDKQTSGTPYCSESCRLAELDRARRGGKDKAGQANTSVRSYPWSGKYLGQNARAGDHKPPTGSYQLATGDDPTTEINPISTRTPQVVKQDSDGVSWISFEYSRDRVKMEYTIRCDVGSVDAENLTMEFKNENAVYPRACCGKNEYRGNRYTYENDCNTIGWCLAELNPCLRGKRGLIQRAVDSWRSSDANTNRRNKRDQTVTKDGLWHKIRKTNDLAMSGAFTKPMPYIVSKAASPYAGPRAPFRDFKDEDKDIDMEDASSPPSHTAKRPREEDPVIESAAKRRSSSQSTPEEKSPLNDPYGSLHLLEERSRQREDDSRQGATPAMLETGRSNMPSPPRNDDGFANPGYNEASIGQSEQAVSFTRPADEAAQRSSYSALEGDESAPLIPRARIPSPFHRHGALRKRRGFREPSSIASTDDDDDGNDFEARLEGALQRHLSSCSPTPSATSSTVDWSKDSSSKRTRPVPTQGDCAGLTKLADSPSSSGSSSSQSGTASTSTADTSMSGGSGPGPNNPSGQSQAQASSISGGSSSTTKSRLQPTASATTQRGCLVNRLLQSPSGNNALLRDHSPPRNGFPNHRLCSLFRSRTPKKRWKVPRPRLPLPLRKLLHPNHRSLRHSLRHLQTQRTVLGMLDRMCDVAEFCV